MRASFMMPTILTAAVLASYVAPARAQNSVDLGKRNARSKYTLGRLFSVSELRDGRVVASDNKEQAFRMVDLAKGEVSIIGQQGSDSVTYRTASVIVPLPGDSLGLFDPSGRKLLHLTPEGTIDRFVRLPTMKSGRRIGTLLGADQNGLLYFTLPEQFDTGTTALAGVARMTRVNVATGADDPQLTYRTRRADQVKLDGIMPYYFRDAVAVRGDGLVARVVAESYQVIWSRDGRETGRTGAIAYTPIPISQAEQLAIKDSVSGSIKNMFGNASNVRTASGGNLPDGVTVTHSGGGGGSTSVTTVMPSGGGASGGAPTVFTSPGSGGGTSQQYINKNGDGSTSSQPMDMKSLMDKMANQPLGKFPDFKPAIISTGVVATFDNDGNLWVARERVHGDPTPHFDVIAEGKGVIGRVNLPAGTRLIGFGKASVYLARDEDGSDWLERYAMPKLQ